MEDKKNMNIIEAHILLKKQLIIYLSGLVNIPVDKYAQALSKDFNIECIDVNTYNEYFRFFIYSIC